MEQQTLLVYLKALLDTGSITADRYNDIIVLAVEQGVIKDITPSVYVLDHSRYQVVGAMVEFPDGTQYEICLYNPPDSIDPFNRYNYWSSVTKLGRFI